MLAHRLRRCPNIETALGECPVFAFSIDTHIVLITHDRVWAQLYIYMLINID